MSVLQMLCVLDAGDLPRCCFQITRAIRFSLRCFSFTSPSCTTDVSDDYIETRSISRRWCGISCVACLVDTGLGSSFGMFWSEYSL